MHTQDIYPPNRNGVRIWKSLRQILTIDQSLKWDTHAATFSSVSAPPSLLPIKKHSDISGIPSGYTDPKTKLRYCSTDEFALVRSLPDFIVDSYLELRKAKVVIK